MHKHKLYQTAKVWRWRTWHCTWQNSLGNSPTDISYLQSNCSSQIVHTLPVTLCCISHSQEKTHIITQVKSIIYEFNRYSSRTSVIFKRIRNGQIVSGNTDHLSTDPSNLRKKNPIPSYSKGLGPMLIFMYGKMCMACISILKNLIRNCLFIILSINEMLPAE